MSILSEATHLAVAGQMEPSQVFLRGLVPFNQLLRREYSQHTSPKRLEKREAYSVV